jgi:hypothetical protein
MANVTCFKHVPSVDDPIPPDGTFYFWIGPLDIFSSGAITVTAHPTKFGPGPQVAQYMEVVQMATRREVSLGGASFYLDLVVRNNSHVGQSDAASIASFDAFISVVTP